MLKQLAVIFGLMGMGLCLLLIVLTGEAKALDLDAGEFTLSPSLSFFVGTTIALGVVFAWMLAIKDAYVMWAQRRRLRP